MNPYHIEGPALISFSGGRTSGYMLHQIVRANDGTLPDDVVVAFANTGKEREETLRFVHECSTRWGVKIHWLEWRDGKPGFEEVGFNSASRSGEPFAALIAKKKRLPNWQERWCTGYLKVEPIFGLMRSLGFTDGRYTEVIGLRNDEGHRILKGLASAEEKGRKVSYPLARAKITKADVMAFWEGQPFDLGLAGHEGNCTLCFLKGRAVKKAIIRDNPGEADWWMAQETTERGTFDRRDSIAGLLAEVRRSPSLFDAIPDDEHDTECGLTCAPEEAA
jgi:3'-phosphoadenosine 5'-phosphosulfate sulfotransferase (PAPS reductase)/FAD synthetase